MSNALPESSVDFQKSSLTWIGREGESSARFALESVCVMTNPATGRATPYGLGAEILAGNVYAADNLVKTPRYLFQAVASEHGHIFFRTFPRHRRAADSYAPNAGLFKKLVLRVERRLADVVPDFPTLQRHFDEHSDLSGRITIYQDTESEAEIEFPVKHINVQRAERRFQIETGPVLVPAEAAETGPPRPKFPTFDVAFVHFSRLDRIELTLRVPIRIGLRSTRFYARTIKVPAAVNILACGS